MNLFFVDFFHSFQHHTLIFYLLKQPKIPKYHLTNANRFLHRHFLLIAIIILIFILLIIFLLTIALNFVFEILPFANFN